MPKNKLGVAINLLLNYSTVLSVERGAFKMSLLDTNEVFGPEFDNSNFNDLSSHLLTSLDVGALAQVS